MIKGAEISNFKGISHCKIDDLKTINLFVGKNNSCKSSIIEAIYYSLKEFTGAQIGDIIRRRTDVSFGPKELWFNYVTQNPIEVIVDFSPVQMLGLRLYYEEPTRSVRVNYRVIDSSKAVIDRNGSTYRSDLSNAITVTMGDSFFNSLSMGKGEIRNYIENCMFLDSSQRKNVASMEQMLGEIKLRGLTDELGHYLSDAYGIGRTWEFLPLREHQGQYRAAVTSEDLPPLFLSGLGDGFRYGLQIIGNTIMAKDTALFIEEIESHQHLGSLKKIIPFLVEITKKNNLQLFITTHNFHNVWRLFEVEFEKDEERNAYFQPYHVKRDDKTGDVTATSQTKENSDPLASDIDEDLLS